MRYLFIIFGSGSLYYFIYNSLDQFISCEIVQETFITTVFINEEYLVCPTSLAHSLDRATSIFLNPVFANRSVVSSAFAKCQGSSQVLKNSLNLLISVICLRGGKFFVNFRNLRTESIAAYYFLAFSKNVQTLFLWSCIQCNTALENITSHLLSYGIVKLALV